MKKVKGFALMAKVVMMVVFVLLITRCGSPKQDPPSDHDPQAPDHVVFVVQDRSGSVERSETEISVQKSFLTKYLQQHFEKPTDIILMGLHTYSGSSVNHRLIPYKTTQKVQEEYVSETDKLLQESSEKMEIRKQQKKMESQLFRALFEEKSEPSSQTAILELLPQISKLSATYASVDIVFLSDMYQESGLRDFDKPSPKTKAVAIEMADADTKEMKRQFSVQEDMLKKVHSIEVLVPSGNDSKMITVPDYWEKVFRNFGYQNPVNWSSR